MTCAHCAQLEEEVAFLRSELGQRYAATDVQIIADTFGLTPGVAHVLRQLYGANGHPVTPWQIAEGLPGIEDRDPEISRVYICRIRKALGRDAVETVRTRGYRLAPASHALVKDTLTPRSPVGRRLS